MIVKLYKNLKVVSCKKCNYNRREKIENNASSETQGVSADAPVEETSGVPENAIDILNKLDCANE